MTKPEQSDIRHKTTLRSDTLKPISTIGKKTHSGALLTKDAKGDFDLEIDQGYPSVSGRKVTVKGTSNVDGVPLTATCYKRDGTSSPMTNDPNPGNTAGGKWIHMFDTPNASGDYFYVVTGQYTPGGLAPIAIAIVGAWFTV